MPDKGTIYGILALVVIGAAIFAYMQLKERKNKALAETGQDKAHLKQVVEKLLPNEIGCRALYGHWEDVQHMGRTTRTTYYSYAVAFDAERLWVAPLKFQQGSILPAQPVLITREDLGRADTDVTTAKDGGIRRVNVVLYDTPTRRTCGRTASTTSTSSRRRSAAISPGLWRLSPARSSRRTRTWWSA